MTKFAFSIRRDVTTTEGVRRVIEATSRAGAEALAMDIASGFNQSCPDDTESLPGMDDIGGFYVMLAAENVDEPADYGPDGEEIDPLGPVTFTPAEEIALQPAVTNAMFAACIAVPPAAKVYAATIHHKHGVNLILAGSETERTAKIAEYCFDNWDGVSDESADGVERGDLEDPAGTLTNDEAVELYFAPENMGEHEYVELYPAEDVALPQPAVPIDLAQLVAEGNAGGDLTVHYDDGRGSEPPACTHCGEPRASNPCEHCNGFDGTAA